MRSRRTGGPLLEGEDPLLDAAEPLPILLLLVVVAEEVPKPVGGEDQDLLLQGGSPGLGLPPRGVQADPDVPEVGGNEGVPRLVVGEGEDVRGLVLPPPLPLQGAKAAVERVLQVDPKNADAKKLLAELTR